MPPRSSAAYQYQGLAQLESVIQDIRVLNFESKYFFPYGTLDYLVTKDSVQAAFRDVKILSPDLVSYVLERAKRIFLLLLLCRRLSQLMTFKKNDIDDSCLPIDFQKNRHGNYEGVSLEHQGPGRSCYSVFSDWSFLERTFFYDTQTWFLAPVFGVGNFRSRIHQKRPLPYLPSSESTNILSSSGFFGEVSRREIHPAHLLPASAYAAEPGKKSIPIAVKTAKEGSTQGGFAEKEALNLQQVTLHEFKSPHLIKPIAAYQIIGGSDGLIFPWADGGHLDSCWEKYGRGSLNMRLARWTIRQFAGLFSALKELHEANCRHGDLKPNNILWFRDGPGHGTLQIADLGLATFHDKDKDTILREGLQTMTPSGTFRYLPPEENGFSDRKGPRSRSYDIWSIGCTLLELVVWLLYGYDGLRVFQKRTEKYFWKESGNSSIIDPGVDRCIQVMRSNPHACQAHKDLLGLVKTRLLVINGRDRAKAPEAYEGMREIARTCEADDSLEYLSEKGLQRSSDLKIDWPERGTVYKNEDDTLAVPGSVRAGTQIQLPRRSPNAHEENNPHVVRRAPTGEFDSQLRSEESGQNTAHNQQSSQLNDDWEHMADKEFVTQWLDSAGWDRVKPSEKESGFNLCRRCSLIDSMRLFESKCDLSRLQSLSRSCDLCGLLLDALARVNLKPPRLIKLRQTEFIIGVENGPNLLSLYTEPGTASTFGHLGLPVLLQQGSPDQFTLMRKWINTCDTAHDMCRRTPKEEASAMPTRLIQLDEPLRLVHSTSMKPCRYAALSHCWGRLQEKDKFCTYKRNMAQLQASIDEKKLPRTFRDAVVIARGLGIKYIWIDSLCIIQDDADDWNSESTKMEQVFSAAYCTISASSARSSLEGFLHERPPRPYIHLSTKSAGNLYVCLDIDNFHRDVELSELNSRGWVLQERALSRRSIHFTSTQAYWECGAGVRCETLSLLRNSKAAFLGDARFPKSALEYYRDGRQVLIQDLYERYSGLAFTKPSDRSVAILGLQERLARALRTPAAYGFFAVYFAREVLWKRGQIKGLSRITQPEGRSIPTWSWLSMEGTIKHMELKFEKVAWEMGDFESPFTHSPNSPNDKEYPTVLRGLARKMHLGTLDMLVSVTFDTDQDFVVDDLRCVVIGRDKEEYNMQDQRSHVLVIRQASENPGLGVYERVGVASLKAREVADEGVWVNIH